MRVEIHGLASLLLVQGVPLVEDVIILDETNLLADDNIRQEHW